MEGVVSSGADLPHSPVIERVIAEMRGDGSLSLHDMAEIAHLSPYHFARVFRRVTDIPPGEFMTALRLERAKRLLLTTDLSATEVCFEVGYNSPGTFTTRFKELVGLPPGRMRRLPEELYAAFDHIRGEGIPPAPVSSGVAFRVHGPDLAGRLIFVGLFPTAIPQGRPAAGTTLMTPGHHRLPPVPDGRYHLMAAALPRSEDPMESLLPGDALRVGRGTAPVTVRAGRSEGCMNVRMRPVLAIDPPVLIALPALLLERLATRALAV
ncbi:MAG: helix-turn-helix transcriptional regulator [Rubrobacteraceae bacterium]